MRFFLSFSLIHACAHMILFKERYQNQYSDNEKQVKNVYKLLGRITALPCCSTNDHIDQKETTICKLCNVLLFFSSKTCYSRIVSLFSIHSWLFVLPLLHCCYIYRSKIHFVFESLSVRLIVKRRNSYSVAPNTEALVPNDCFSVKPIFVRCVLFLFISVFCSYSSSISIYRRYIHSHWCLL